jgi:iron uptake system EfeUOB component EfeO/EfeM
MSLRLRFPTRSAIAIAAASVAVAIVAFAIFTALGLGGGETRPSRAPITSAQEQIHISANVRRYSERIARQEDATPAGSAARPEEQPVDPALFRRPIARYRAYARGQLLTLEAELRSLRGALTAGSRSAARAAWLVAFERYLRLGAVYGLLPTLDQEIGVNPASLPDGAQDSRFTGFHRIEYGLWRGQAPASLLACEEKLARAVRAFRSAVATVRITPKEYARRAHEILEDDERDYLSGNDLPYSDDGVAATAATLAATQEVLDTLTRPLRGQSSVGPTTLYLNRLARLLSRLRAEHHGTWPTLSQLSPREQEELDGTLAAALSSLSDVPGELEVHLPVAVQRIPQHRGGGQ